MGDENLLLDHARRYFAQAGQSGDMKKMRMLAELGLEFLGLAQQGGSARAGGGAPAPSSDTAPAPEPDQDGTGKAGDRSE